LPDLKLLQRGEKPVVKLLEGVEGSKALFEDMIKSAPKSIDEFANMDAVHAIFSRDDLTPLRKELARLAIKGKLLYTSKKPLEQIQSRVVARHIHPQLVPFSGDIILYQNKTAFSTFHGKLITVIIDSEVITNTIRSLFELAWESALIPKN
jgi:hypothetical protein